MDRKSAATMIFVPGGTYRTGWDKHYPEEAPSHRVTVDGFWIDSTTVTNREFRKFVNDTGHVTFAEVARGPNCREVPEPDIAERDDRTLWNEIAGEVVRNVWLDCLGCGDISGTGGLVAFLRLRKTSAV